MPLPKEGWLVELTKKDRSVSEEYWETKPCEKACKAEEKLVEMVVWELSADAEKMVVSREEGSAE